MHTVEKILPLTFQFRVTGVVTLRDDRYSRSPETIASRKREGGGLGRVFRYANRRKIRKSFGVQFVWS